MSTHRDKGNSGDTSAETAVVDENSGVTPEVISYDSKWRSQLGKTAERDNFRGHNVFQWNSNIERI